MIDTRKPARMLCASLAVGSLLSLPLHASDHDESHTANTVTAPTPAVAEDSETSTATDFEQQASDAWLEGKLETVYLFNRHLNNFTIDPDVAHGAVVLTGAVDSTVSKELAGELAQGVEGITDVTNRLTVADDTRGNENGRDFSERVEDATLTAEVKTLLLANSETSGLQINVDTTGSEVTLSGRIDSSAEKDLAGEIASQVDGVTGVNNELQVNS
ncbi:MAG: BON domain-containing protein [Halieaceae bacterium]|uniref:BON domain-containing protein n=1 Tax=Haliea alexandrii TaxID=2448162 RepID=UPI000F0B7C96|nr:BON domain-containing protein [Haliea alexandrii]MCR9185649.1 BON domain-containing protein [Halieaceae bacterium]